MDETALVLGVWRLFAEMLAQAAEDLHSYGLPYYSARRWLLEDTPGWPLSFTMVCEALGFSPDRMRRRMLRRRRPRPREFSLDTCLGL